VFFVCLLLVLIPIVDIEEWRMVLSGDLYKMIEAVEDLCKQVLITFLKTISHSPPILGAQPNRAKG
jgi:hypothetical protein